MLCITSRHASAGQRVDIYIAIWVRLKLCWGQGHICCMADTRTGMLTHHVSWGALASRAPENIQQQVRKESAVSAQHTTMKRFRALAVDIKPAGATAAAAVGSNSAVGDCTVLPEAPHLLVLRHCSITKLLLRHATAHVHLSALRNVWQHHLEATLLPAG